MRKVHYYYLITFLFIGISCNSLKDLAVIGIPMEFERTFNVVANNDVGLSFQANDTIDFTDNADVAANLDNIDRYEIKKITYTISKVVSENKTPKLIDGNIVFSSFSNEEEQVISSLVNLDLIEVQENSIDVDQELSLTTENIELLAGIFTTENKIKLSYEATMDTVVSFTIDVKLGLSLKIGI